jgi:hypothetical protein
MCYGVARSPGESGGCCELGTALTFDRDRFVCGKQSEWGSCLFTCSASETTVVPLEIPEALAEHEYFGAFRFEMRWAR